MDYFRINYQHSRFFGKDHDYMPDDFIDDIFFNIYDDDDDGVEYKVGEGHIKILDFCTYANYPYDLDFYFSDIIDSDRQIFNLFEVISNPKFIFNRYYNSELYKAFFLKKFDCGLLYDKVAYLEKLNIFNDYQGSGIGSMVLKELHDKFDVDYIAVIPFPLEFNKKSKEDYKPKDFDLKMKKVINFYKKNGYKQIAKSEFYMLTYNQE